MSLLKALSNYSNSTTATILLHGYEKDFKELVKHIVDGMDKGKQVHKNDVAAIVATYANYSYHYLAYVAIELKEPSGVSQTMKFMNSFIAEFIAAAGLHYYDLHKGYSVVDKAVQFALDAPEQHTVISLDVIPLIDELEDSYIEDDIVEEVEGTVQ